MNDLELAAIAASASGIAAVMIAALDADLILRTARERNDDETWARRRSNILADVEHQRDTMIALNLALVAGLSIVWALQSAKGVNGWLVTVLVPIGAVTMGRVAAQASLRHLPRKWIGRIALVAAIIAIGAFGASIDPPSGDDLG